MGVKPTYPSEKYGYIVPKQDRANRERNGYLTVDHFTGMSSLANASQG
jgi:mannose-1-phosphate guanylyltransferase